MFLILLLLFCAIFKEGETKLCGLQNQCICLKNLRQASCLRKNLSMVPKFSEREESLFDYLDLRWNNIHFLPGDDKFLPKLRFIDLTFNPVQCNNITRWKNVKTDCLFKDSLRKNNSVSFKTTLIGSVSRNRHSNKVSTNSQGRTTATRPDSVTSPALVLDNPETIRHNPETTPTTITRSDPTTTFAPVALTQETTTPSTVHIPGTTPMPNPSNPQRKSTISLSTMAEMRVDQTESIDFYLHVTLGPMGVLYVLGTLFVILKRWWIRRRQHTREM